MGALGVEGCLVPGGLVALVSDPDLDPYYLDLDPVSHILPDYGGLRYGRLSGAGVLLLLS